MADAPTVLIMGPPGAGKGTQAAHLASRYALRHVATGDLLRDAVAASTPLGVQARQFMDAGNLVPDDVIIALIRETAASLSSDAGLLLDGFPRTTAQAEALDSVLADLGREIDVVLDIRVPDDVIVERLSSRWICRTCQTPYNVVSRPPRVAGVCDVDGGELYQRTDDTPESVRNRLEVYRASTEPVAAYYAERSHLVRVDGDLPPDEVQAAVDEAMSSVVG